MQTLLYIHGFKSSARSQKARQLQSALDGVRADWEFMCPNLSHDPTEAMALLTRTVERIPASQLTLLGSSLGGFYALALTEKFGCRAVLLNPSLKPYETLAAHLGEQENLHTGERFTFTQEHLAALRAMSPTTLADPTRYLLIVEMGDALLDHRATCAALSGAKQIVVEGGNHDLQSFPQHLTEIFAFAGLTKA